MNKKLTIEQQIAVLKCTRREMNKSDYVTGLCRELRHSLLEINNIGAGYACEIQAYIPSFTYENAIELSKKYGFTKPRAGQEDYYWWEKGVKRPRIMLVNALIKELQLHE